VPETRHSGKRPSPSARDKALGEEVAFPECQWLGTRGRAFPIFFKRFRLLAPSNATLFFRVLVFPECFSSPSATLGEDCLPRVPDFWHSGKHVALGEFCFSRSEGPRAAAHMERNRRLLIYGGRWRFDDWITSIAIFPNGCLRWCGCSALVSYQPDVQSYDAAAHGIFIFSIAIMVVVGRWLGGQRLRSNWSRSSLPVLKPKMWNNIQD
jgi:hypothetical protein